MTGKPACGWDKTTEIQSENGDRYNMLCLGDGLRLAKKL